MYIEGIPQNLLMVRKSDMYTFFEKNKIHDNNTSFIATYTASSEKGNTYSFNNIAPLITRCIREKEQGNVSDDWNKVVLIPVMVDTDSQRNIIGIKSNLNMESARLKGGKEDPVKMRVLYTTF